MKLATMTLAAVALSLAAAGPSAICAAEKPLNPKAITIKLPDHSVETAMPPATKRLPSFMAIPISQVSMC